MEVATDQLDVRKEFKLTYLYIETDHSSNIWSLVIITSVIIYTSYYWQKNQGMPHVTILYYIIA